ncbi:MAG: hypothetical protein RJA22_3327 [Verrucomicrobiota bacterium]|jgi:hypothetical protein
MPPRRGLPRTTWAAAAGLVLLAALLAPRPAGAAGAKAADAPPVIRVPSPAQLEKSIRRGVDYLVKKQNKDGSWGSATRTKDLNIFAPVPGSHQAFRAATTALAISALIETGAADTNAAARRALERGEAWLLDNLGKVRRADGVALYNVWTHGYGLHALTHLLRRETTNAARRAAISNLAVLQVDLLRRYESVDGGWGYYDFRHHTQRPTTDAISFTTATILIAMHEARQAGLPVNEDVTRRAVASVIRQTKNDYSYYYGEYLKYRPMTPVNRPAGSLGRSQACNLALRLHGQTNITDQVMTDWLDRLVTRGGWLDIGRKRPIPHEAWFQIAGYFFYYGHYYAALVIEHLGPEKAGQFKGPLAGIITQLQEKDGSWFDFPFYDYHQPYGTSFALMTLARCRAP